MSKQELPRVITKIDPARVLPWLQGRLQSHQEPQKEGRAYYLMFAKGKQITIGVEEIRKPRSAEKEEVVAIEVPPELEPYGVIDIESANHAIMVVERHFESAMGIDKPCQP